MELGVRCGGNWRYGAALLPRMSWTNKLRGQLAAVPVDAAGRVACERRESFGCGLHCFELMEIVKGGVKFY